MRGSGWDNNTFNGRVLVALVVSHIKVVFLSSFGYKRTRFEPGRFNYELLVLVLYQDLYRL